MQTKVSFFNNIFKPTVIEDCPFDLFLTDIATGKWQDAIIELRANKQNWSPDYYNSKKSKLPGFTTSGTFSHRSIAGLKEHSGLIQMDLDGKDNPILMEPGGLEAVRNQFKKDQYCYSAFVSCGGQGLALVYKINPKKHSEAFAGLSSYIFNNYNGLICDPSGKDVSRIRFVSYDPFIHINSNANKFAIYPPPPPKALTKLPKAVWVQDDFTAVVNEIVARRLDLTTNYQDWLNMGFAISEKMGAAGASYFDAISQFHPKYDLARTQRQYDAICRHTSAGNNVTIATFYYYAKSAGLQVISERTKLIATTASQSRKGGRKKESAAKVLSEMENIPESESMPIIDQVYDYAIDIVTEESFVSEVKIWLKQNYTFRNNLVSRRVEMNGVYMEDEDYNSVYISGKEVFDNLTFDLIDRIIKSSFTPKYNPFFEFFDKYKEQYPDDGTAKNFELLFDSIGSDTYTEDYRKYFLFKWLIGIISSIHGEHSVLFLIFSGAKVGTGKTEFFRRLLPPELKKYYSESKLDAGKDDQILMCKKILIFDDEMAGKSKKESNNLKNFTSKDIVTARPSYGRTDIDMKRLAVLGGTSNESELLHDPTENRRYIPMNIHAIDHDKYNAVDKIGLLMELYWLFHKGNNHKLTSADIDYLNVSTSRFEAPSPEKEMLLKYFRIPESETDAVKWITNTEIKATIEKRSVQKISPTRLGLELKKMGFEQRRAKIKGSNSTYNCYGVVEISLEETPFNIPEPLIFV